MALPARVTEVAVEETLGKPAEEVLQVSAGGCAVRVKRVQWRCWRA